MDNRPIGLFDSGVGGLTVAKQVMKVLPHEDIVYFGDTARVPYGSKTKETVTKFSEQIIRFLLTKDVKAIIIACNTASANSYHDLIRTFPDMPIFEVITAGVESCIAATKNKKVGITGTQATVRSGAYELGIKQRVPDMRIYAQACPLFVNLAEEGWTDNEVARLTAHIYLDDMLEKGVDTIVLGCTHYPLLKRCIAGIVGENVTLVDPAKATALKMKKFLEEADMLSGTEEGRHTFYVSDHTPSFDNLCERLLKKHYTAEKIDIEKY
ncbi:MAG: glutamate racemase [Firmicutes bacterium]|nr:glutamate racemase [Bacillota bacterium]